jgi:hypothetical protein
LAEALDLLNGRALLNVDIKAAGYEDAVLEMVCAKGMLADVLFSSLIPAILPKGTNCGFGLTLLYSLVSW